MPKRQRTWAKDGPAAKKSKNMAIKRRSRSLANPTRTGFSVERKNTNTLTTGSFPAATTTATLTLLNGIDDGATSTTRVGRRVNLTEFSWKFKINMATTTVGASPVRNLVVYDKQPNAAPPAILDVVFVNSITSAMNLNNSKRFIVLSDKCYDGIGTQGPQSMFEKGYMRLNLPMEFNDASTAAIDSITTGSVYLIQWSDGGFGTAAPVDAYFSRFRYTDV